MMYHVYLLRSLSHPDQYYTGFTENPDERLRQHNAGASPHTARYRPWQRIVDIGFADRSRALRFERYLKSGSGRAFAAKHLR